MIYKVISDFIHDNVTFKKGVELDQAQVQFIDTYLDSLIQKKCVQIEESKIADLLGDKIIEDLKQCKDDGPEGFENELIDELDSIEEVESVEKKEKRGRKKK